MLYYYRMVNIDKLLWIDEKKKIKRIHWRRWTQRNEDWELGRKDYDNVVYWLSKKDVKDMGKIKWLSAIKTFIPIKTGNSSCFVPIGRLIHALDTLGFDIKSLKNSEWYKGYINNIRLFEYLETKVKVKHLQNTGTPQEIEKAKTDLDYFEKHHKWETRQKAAMQEKAKNLESWRIAKERMEKLAYEKVPWIKF